MSNLNKPLLKLAGTTFDRDKIVEDELLLDDRYVPLSIIKL